MDKKIEKVHKSDIESLKTELKNLEFIYEELSFEKFDLEKLLSEFKYRHSLELDEIINEILVLRKIKFKDDKLRYEEAVNDEKQYKEQAITDNINKIYDLTQEQKTNLKKKFREATFLCHPDKVSEEFKTFAENIFNELKTAYELNNLDKVSEILNDLKRGGFNTNSETFSEKDLLITAIAKLQNNINIIIKQIVEIKNSDSYKTIKEIENWDYYFTKIKNQLEVELEILKREI